MWNAIALNLIRDEAGRSWLTLGSFWGGIKLVQLHPDLTAPAQPEKFMVSDFAWAKDNGGANADGGSFRRSVCIDNLYYNKDGTMKRVVMTTEGVKAAK